MVDEVARQWPQRPRFLQSFFLATHVPKTAAPSPASSLCPKQEEGTAKGEKVKGSLNKLSLTKLSQKFLVAFA